MARHHGLMSLDRRRFLAQAGLATAWLAGGASLVGQPRPQPPFTPISRSDRVVRVRGRVHAAGAGLARVAVTDGVSVVQTARDGSFTLVASARQPFVYVSVPASCEIPVSETGTARFYRPLVPGPGDEMAVEFALTPRRASSERHGFVALADTQTLDAEDMARLHQDTVPDVQQWVASQGGQPSFGVAVGDIMYDNLALYPDYERAVKAMGAPFFQVVGNHDLDFSARSAELATSTFMRHFGPPYYSFDVGAVHYVVLQDVLWHGTAYVGYVDDRQLAWLEADLALVEAGRPVVVFLHIPLESRRWVRVREARPGASVSVNNRAAVYALLERFSSHVISGHTHENEHVFEGGVHEHVLGAVCGAWWSGPICYDGSPCGYGVFDVRGETIQWHYKSTGHPLDHQLRVYGPGSDATAPDELVANVWHWDPQWQVEWVADGQPRGPMARRVGLDPLSVELHRGQNRPKKHPWVEPVPTDHLFFAPVAPTTREVLVRATDRFGRTFTGTWRRA